MRLIYGLSGARLEKAVGRQGGVAAASRGIRLRQGVARFEISEVQTLFGSATVGAVSKRFLPALLDARYGVGNRLFPGEIIVTEMRESLQVVEMDRMNL